MDPESIPLLKLKKIPELNQPLSYLHAGLFTSILEDCITELRILLECNNEMRISMTMSDMELLLAKKFGVAEPVADELANVDPRNLHQDEYKIKKLDADRIYLIDVMSSTYVDMSLNRTFQALTDHVKKRIDRDDYMIFVSEEEANNKAHLRDLHKQLRQQRNHVKTKIYDSDGVIDTLQRRVEDAGVTAATRGRYVDNWQCARTEQHLLTISEKESPLTQRIEYYKRGTDHEQRIHSEVELLINIATNETIEKIEKWMDKYDVDMEAIDLNIQIKKNNYQNMFEKRRGLEDTLEKHDKAIKDWIHFKDEREKARQYVEKMTKSAIMVQAWWRGLLVRMQLGPYKVVKKKGGGKKK